MEHLAASKLFHSEVGGDQKRTLKGKSSQKFIFRVHSSWGIFEVHKTCLELHSKTTDVEEDFL